MKLSNDQICTTTEVLKEFFAMPDRLIYNMPERERYERIYEYLSQAVEKGEALSLGKLKINEEECYRFEFQGELYIIPLEFMESEEAENEENEETSAEEVVVPFKKAN